MYDWIPRGGQTLGYWLTSVGLVGSPTNGSSKRCSVLLKDQALDTSVA